MICHDDDCAPEIAALKAEVERLTQALATSERENARHRGCVQVEGDYVCGHEVAARDLANEVERLTTLCAEQEQRLMSAARAVADVPSLCHCLTVCQCNSPMSSDDSTAPEPVSPPYKLNPSTSSNSSPPCDPPPPAADIPPRAQPAGVGLSRSGPPPVHHALPWTGAPRAREWAWMVWGPGLW